MLSYASRQNENSELEAFHIQATFPSRLSGLTLKSRI
jgi:hypothetical protein